MKYCNDYAFMFYTGREKSATKMVKLQFLQGTCKPSAHASASERTKVKLPIISNFNTQSAT